MSKSVVINLGNGDLSNGFPIVTAQLRAANHPYPQQFIGSLPPAPTLVELYRRWQLIYKSLCDGKEMLSPSKELDDDELEIDETGVTNISKPSFNEVCKDLQIHINNWLKSEAFLNIERQLRSQLGSTEEVRVIIETNDELLRRLPWHRWEFFNDYPLAEMALSRPEYKRREPLESKVSQKKVRILAVLGNTSGIDLETETKFLKSLNDAEIEFIANASRQELNAQLWNNLGWDILFFAGHSQTEGETGRIYINENETNNSLTIEELEEAVKQAIENGLKLAIFNSCDGLGLANTLEKLNIPTVIVMREPVPNRVAQEFFKHFLDAFAFEQLPLYLAVQQARRKLQGLENDFPAASWLPVICQNPAVEPPIWQKLGRFIHCPHQNNRDWGEAPDLPVFFGRSIELETLEKWILEENCRLVAILGMQGVGKTDLSLKLAQGIQDQFEYVIWRSLLNAPPITSILENLIKFISNQKEITLPESLEECISLLLNYLRSHRCLLILDNIETVLQCQDVAGEYREGYEGYGQLFKLIGELPHQSCLLLTSREKPKEIARLEGKNRPVRSLELNGLDVGNGQKIFTEIAEFSGSELEWQELINFYNGNPLALELVAKHINEVFFGDISAFLQERKQIFNDLKELLDWHFERLSQPEKEIVYWLAINREPTSIREIKEDILSPVTKNQVASTLQSLQKRLCIERIGDGFTLQPVLIEYITEQIITQIVKEILTEQLLFLNIYSLLKATAKQYIMAAQARLIIKPIIEIYISYLGCQGKLEAQLRQILATLRTEIASLPGYAAGNILNLLRHLETDLIDYDFSHLVIRQAYLQGATLHNVNFAYATFDKCVFTQKFGGVLSVVFSPDGQKIATSNANGEIHLWRVEDGQHLLACRGHTNWVRRVAFSPNGQRLASVSEDRTIRIWNLQNGVCLHKIGEHTHNFRSVNFSPDGQMLVSGSDDLIIRIWNVNSQACLREIKGHEGWVLCVIFSPDGKQLASGSCDGTIRIWSVDSGECLRVIRGHDSWVVPLSFSPDGERIASGSLDRSVRIWNINGECLQILQEHTGWVWAVTFSPDGQLIASAGEDLTLRIWDANNGRCLHAIKEHTKRIWGVAFHPDGRRLASCSEDQTIRLWDVKDGRCLNIIQGDTNWIKSIAFSPNSKTLFSAHKDHTVKIWDLSTYQCLQVLKGHTESVLCVAVDASGQMLASAGEDQTIRIWQIPAQTCCHLLKGHTSDVWSIAFSPDGQKLVSGSFDQTVRIWDLRDGQCLYVLEGHSDRIGSVAFSPQGTLVASASEDHTIKIWNVANGECLFTLQGHTHRVRAVTFSPNGQTLASASLDETVKIWNVQNGECLQTLNGHTGWVLSVAFSSDGQYLVSSGVDRAVKIWNIQNGTSLKTLEGHTNWVWSVAFSPHDRIIASAGEDELIKFWDITTGECLTTLRAKRPYEGTNIIGVNGIAEAQKATLKALGAVEISWEKSEPA